MTQCVSRHRSKINRSFIANFFWLFTFFLFVSPSSHLFIVHFLADYCLDFAIIFDLHVKLDFFCCRRSKNTWVFFDFSFFKFIDSVHEWMFTRLVVIRYYINLSIWWLFVVRPSNFRFTRKLSLLCSANTQTQKKKHITKATNVGPSVSAIVKNTLWFWNFQL